MIGRTFLQERKLQQELTAQHTRQLQLRSVAPEAVTMDPLRWMSVAELKLAVLATTIATAPKSLVH